MADKVSTIVLTVDLGCSRCHNKVKKTLCKYRERYQIQEEIFDEKENTVTLSGPFCPKKLAKKLCCKAGDAIKCIKIIDKKPPSVSVVPPVTVDPPTLVLEVEVEFELEPETPPVSPPTKPCHPTPQPIGVCPGPCYEGCGGGPCHQGYGRPPRCNDGYGRPPPPCNCGCERPPPPCNGGCERPPPPCNRGCEIPPPPCNCGCERPPPPCNCGCERPPPYYGGNGRSTCMSPCGKYFSEEDPNSCIIM